MLSAVGMAVLGVALVRVVVVVPVMGLCVSQAHLPRRAASAKLAQQEPGADAEHEQAGGERGHPVERLRRHGTAEGDDDAGEHEDSDGV